MIMRGTVFNMFGWKTSLIMQRKWSGPTPDQEYNQQFIYYPHLPCGPIRAIITACILEWIFDHPRREGKMWERFLERKGKEITCDY